MNGSANRSRFATPTMQAATVVLVLGAIFAPDGFFTGHRTVVLDVEITVADPVVHRPGDETPGSATLTGTVTTASGMPISGALLTAFNEPKTRRRTVYTGSDGIYTLSLSFVGELTVRARTPYFADVTQEITFPLVVTKFPSYLQRQFIILQRLGIVVKSMVNNSNVVQGLTFY